MAPLRDILRSFIRGITIEPVVILYHLTNAISAFALNNLILQKACHPELTEEPDYSVPCPDEKAAQRVNTSINTWKIALESIPAVFFIILLGAWSDSHGKRRKPLLFIPLLGEVFRIIWIMVCIYFWKISPVVTAAIEGCLRGLSGGFICFGFGVNTYISDISSVEDRTFRLGIMTSLAFIGSPVGIMLGGVLRMKLGFFNLYVLCLLLTIIALILCVLLMKNTACVESKLKTFEGLCDGSQFIQALKTVLKKRPGKERTVLLLMSCVAPIYIACFIGEFTVMYLFLRYKFNVGEIEFGNYCAYKMITICIGSFVSLAVCSKLLRMSDAAIGCLGTITQILSSYGLCFAQHKWEIYVYPIVDFMHGAAGTASRSIISKTVDPTELGQIFSVICVVDVVAPLFVTPAYNIMYKYTMNVLPGAFFFLSILLAFVYLTLFASVYIIERRKIKLDRKTQNVNGKEAIENSVPLL